MLFSLLALYYNSFNQAGGNGGGRRGGGGAGRPTVALCSDCVAHYSQRNAPGARFACGYRNIQMLCSSLMALPQYRRVLFGGTGVSHYHQISSLKRTIVLWKRGIDDCYAVRFNSSGKLSSSVCVRAHLAV
jgi:Peptidase family C78